MRASMVVPAALGVFCVVAAAADWDWFFTGVCRTSPLNSAMSPPAVRIAVRLTVAALGVAVAAVGGAALAGFV